MKTLIRLMTAFCHFVVLVFIGMLIAVLFGCCSRVNYYPVESYRTDSVFRDRWLRDSIYIRDSVFLETKNDTVWLTKTKTVYRDRVIRDSVGEAKCDTTTVVREVPREFTKLQTLKMNIGSGVMWAIPIILFLYILYRKLKK